MRLAMTVSARRGLGVGERDSRTRSLAVRIRRLSRLDRKLHMDTKRDSINTDAMRILAKDLTKDYPRSPRETLSGYVIAARTLDKCRATLAGTAGEYHFDCPLDNFFFAFAGLSAENFKNFVATGASDKEVANWIERTAKKRPRIEIIKWDNDWRYKRLPDLPDAMQEFMEDYIPQFVPARIRHHIDYFFDIYDAEEKRIIP
jgi:Domain of unknown function (DUF5069)